MKVLVAEDSAMFRHMLASHLARWGYDMVVANDGISAWNMLQSSEAPRLAILDWLMPGLDGPEICRRVRAAGREPYIYLILLTGKDSRNDIVSGLQAGADDYVTKPFNVQELEVRLRAGKRIVDLQAALIAAREQLRTEATHDALTGLYNRGAVMKTLARDCARATREATSLSVALVDIDFFKKVNDTYGHDAGDRVLQAVAVRMGQALRPYDVLARYGGEEFLLLLPACDHAAAVAVADRVRAQVAAEPVTLADGISLPVTCSIGVSSQAAHHDPASLIGLADAALYRAKAAGRNRVL